MQKQQNIRIVIESLSKLRDVIKKKVLKYIEIRKEAILHLFKEASEFEEFEIELSDKKRSQLPDKRQLQHDPFIFIY